MTVRNFWMIFIKILGIWLVLDSLVVIPQYFSSVIYNITSGNGEELVYTLALLTIGLLFYLFIIRLFILKTGWLINKLQLEKDFNEEKIELNVPREVVLKIACIVIGGLILVREIPDFCRELFFFFQRKTLLFEDQGTTYIIFHLVSILIGYLMMTKFSSIVGFIEKKTSTEHKGNN